MDAGALVLVVPTIRSYEEAIKARDWAYFPPLGKRSLGRRPGVQHVCQRSGGYRQTINDNLVLILMIETLDGQDADRIAKIPGVTAIFAASADLGNLPAPSRTIRITNARSTSCTMPRSRPVSSLRPIGLARPSGLHLFPGGTELAAIAKGAKEELAISPTPRASRK